jgi:hypothetical protein
MFGEFYAVNGRNDVAQRVGQYRLEGRLRSARRNSVGWALAFLGRVPRPDRLPGAGGMEPRGA